MRERGNYFAEIEHAAGEALDKADNDVKVAQSSLQERENRWAEAWRSVQQEPLGGGLGSAGCFPLASHSP